MTKFRLCLLPPPEVGLQLEELSQKICGPNQSFVLGVDSVPHVTLLKTEVEKADDVWQAVQDLPPPPPVTTDGFYSVLWHNDTCVYLGLQVPLTSELLAFQDAAYRALQSWPTKGERGQAYSPHYTLGYLKVGEHLSVDLAEATCRLPLHPCGLGLGTSGPEGQLKDVLFSR